MKFGKILLLSLIFVSLILSVFFSVKSFTGYLISDISDSSGNMNSFIFLMLGLLATFAYIKTFKNR